MKSFPSSPGVTRSQIRAARIADLFRYLETYHPSLVRRTGRCLYWKEKDSVYIKEGVPGYMDFSSGSHGNSIDFLMRYLNYRFVDAVLALTGFINVSVEKECHSGKKQSNSRNTRQIIPPSCAPKPFRILYAYLQERGIPAWLIRQMVDGGILYQEYEHGNLVFMNPQKDYCEIRGTYGGVQNHFHSCRKSSADRFWYLFNTDAAPRRAFICEAAIDAVSLLLLHRKAGIMEPSVYVSIGGVYNQKAIDRLKHNLPSVIAVDNDPAGAYCRQRNKDVSCLIPVFKDWNEDLQKGIIKGAIP